MSVWLIRVIFSNDISDGEDSGGDACGGGGGVCGDVHFLCFWLSLFY